jgi:hypothetical protein
MEGFGSSRVENKVGGAGCYDKSFKYTGCEEHCASAESGDSAGPFHLARSKKNSAASMPYVHFILTHRNTSNILLHRNRCMEQVLKMQPCSLRLRCTFALMKSWPRRACLLLRRSKPNQVHRLHHGNSLYTSLTQHSLSLSSSHHQSQQRNVQVHRDRVRRA